MRFTIKQTGVAGERVGCLSNFAKSSSVIETPTSALLTQGASVVHLTADVLGRVISGTKLLWVPLSSSIQLENGVKAQGEGVAKFAALPDHVVCSTLLSVSDNTPGGHFEADKVPLWTKNGKKMITAERYMDLMEVFQPDMILAIADGHTALSEGFKRIVKAVNRSCLMLDKCVDRYKASTQLRNSSLIAVITGTAMTRRWQESVKHILSHKEVIGGVALQGISDGTEETFNTSVDKLQILFKDISEALPKDLLRIVEGSWSPAVVVSAIEHGWDVFDGSYPLKLTNAGRALVLTYDVTKDCDEPCILDLNDSRYKDEFRPIQEGCTCLACVKHTRAYVCHLLNTREMLSSVLLSIHNLHNFDLLFQNARAHIASNTFQVYKHHVIKQYERYRASLPERPVVVGRPVPETPDADAPDSGHVKKKIRVTNGVQHLVVNDS